MNAFFLGDVFNYALFRLLHELIYSRTFGVTRLIRDLNGQLGLALGRLILCKTELLWHLPGERSRHLQLRRFRHMH